MNEIYLLTQDERELFFQTAANIQMLSATFAQTKAKIFIRDYQPEEVQ
ncbi:MAG: hypothetical protein K2X08_06740 [Chlamydiales bacterium]|nr:hypothetical protein [Chlamydiales bacterium]